MPLLLALAVVAADCRMIDEGVRLCAARLPPVRALSVRYVGPTPANGGSEDCRGFAPTVRDVRAYLHRAERTDADTVHYALPESQCVSRGRIMLAGGRRGTWEVDRFAIMRLAFDHSPAIILYCPDCGAGECRH